MITVKADMNGVPEALTELLREQLPFATALALTRAAQAGQEAGRELVGQVFKERNDWTRRGVRITPAKKTDLVAEVYTDTSNRQSGAPDYLLPQDQGAEKVPVGGREHLAIPTKYCRQLAGGDDKPIPDWLRPKALLQYVETKGKYTTRRGKERNLPALIRGFYFFKVNLKSGAMAILARYSGDTREAAYPVYILVTQAHIRKRFPLEQRVQQAVEQQFPQIFERAAAEVLVNGNLRGSGLQVRF